jgi:hypothetical protein
MDTTTTPHTALALHIQRHKYTKGAHTGEAPADTSRRAKTHFRVLHYPYNDTYAVRFHSTDILTAYPDGRIRLHTNGWHDSPTTRDAMRDAIYIATKQRAYLHSVRHNGLTQTALRIDTRTLRYYDGMEFKDGQLITTEAPFERYVADKEARAVGRAEAQPLRDVMPLLLASLPEGRRDTLPGYWDATSARRLRDMLQDPDKWQGIVARHAKGTPQQTWSSIGATLTVGMNKVVPV